MSLLMERAMISFVELGQTYYRSIFLGRKNRTKRTPFKTTKLADGSNLTERTKPLTRPEKAASATSKSTRKRILKGIAKSKLKVARRKKSVSNHADYRLIV